MSERPIAGRIWAGRLRVTTPVTAVQDFDLVSGIVQESVYFEFGDGHPEHGDLIDLAVGLCDDPIREGGMAVMLFPAVLTIFEPDFGVEDALALVAWMVRDAIDGWYETPERFRVGFIGIDDSRGRRRLP
jgi:hypothetical protein